MIKSIKKWLFLFGVVAAMCFSVLFASNVYSTKAAVQLSETHCRFLYDTGICSTTLGVNSEISLPVAKINTDVQDSRVVIDCALTVLKDGTVMDGYNKALSYGSNFKFLSEGFYEFIYSAADDSVSDTETFSIMILGDAPKFVYTERQEYLIEKDSYVLAPDAKFFDGNVELSMSAVIVYPDGNAYNLVRQKVSKVGGYKIILSTVLGNKYFSFTKEFYVFGINGNISSISSISYGDSPFVEELKTMGSYTDKTGDEKLVLPEEGVNLSLSGGEYYQHGEIIDLSKIGATDKLFNAYVRPHGDIGVNAEIYVELIDVNDPDNYLSVMFDTAQRYSGVPKSGYWVYVRAAVPSIGQEYVGAFMNYSGAGGKNVLFARLGGGAHGGVDISGYTPDYYPLSFGYDETTKQVYYYKLGGNESMLAADMDDETTPFAVKYIPNSAMITDYKGFYPGCPWQGFSSDLVYMRVRVVCDTALDITITDIAGLSLEPKFKTTYFANDDYTLIYDNAKIDFDNLPVAVVGAAYPLPNIAIRDASGAILDTDVEIYNSLNSELKIANDKKSFVPNVNGEYVVNIIAKDLYGYKKTFTYTVNAVEESDYSGVIINLGEISSMTTGVNYVVPSAEITGSNNAVFITITAPNGENMTAEYYDGFKFKPVLTGEYTLKYSVQNHLGWDYYETVKIESVASDDPIVDSGIILPKYFLAGQTYILPQLIAYDYKADGSAKQVEAVISVFADSATIGTEISDYIYNVPVDIDSVRIVYTATTLTGSWQEEYIVSVQKVVDSQNNLILEKYFVPNNATVSNTSDGIKVSTDTTNGSVEFIKPLFISSKGFYIDLTVLSDENFTDLINIYLQDSADAENIVKITLLKGNETDNQTYSYITVNDGDAFLIPGSFYNNNSRYMIEYYNDTFKVTSYNNAYQIVSKTMSGADFNGFTSNSVYMTIEFGTVETDKTASILISRVNNQKLNSTINSDKTAPQILVSSEMSQCVVGDVVSTEIVNAADVLSNNTTVFVKVVDAARNVVVSLDDVVLDKVPADRVYEFSPATIGNYVITYYAYDDSGNNLSATEKVNCLVIDIIAPQITVSERVADTLALKGGVATLTLPKASAVDDDGTVLTVKYWLVKPNGLLELISGDSVALNDAGKYQLIVFAEDKSGNFATESFTIFVK